MLNFIILIVLLTLLTLIVDRALPHPEKKNYGITHLLLVVIAVTLGQYLGGNLVGLVAWLGGSAFYIWKEGGKEDWEVSNLTASADRIADWLLPLIGGGFYKFYLVYYVLNYVNTLSIL
jgi:hypothetical protein